MADYTPDPERSHQFYLSTLPDDARARLAEPRDEDFKAAFSGALPKCLLKARDPATTLSPFLRVFVTYLSNGGQDLAKLAKIYNVDKNFGWSGGGHGFHPDDIKGRPRLRMAFSSREGLPALWALGNFFVASPEMYELLRKYEPEALASVATDLEFDDGGRGDGYVFLDVIAKRYAWDYARSDVEVYLSEGRRRLQLEAVRTLRADIPSTAHLFRDAAEPRELLVSREVAEQMEALSSAQLMITDHQCEAGSHLRQHRIRKQRSRFKTTAPTRTEQESWRERLRSQIEPLIRGGEFTAAETQLTQWLRELDPTPYHIAADLRITTSAQTVASYFDDYARKAASEHELAVVYCEMNGFTINPDLWFCDAFGFTQDGGRDDHHWLGGFASASDTSLLIEGLEPLQQVFEEAMEDRAGDAPFETARRLARVLVITKFQRMLQGARPLMRAVSVPLLGCAHDDYEYLAEIR